MNNVLYLGSIAEEREKRLLSRKNEGKEAESALEEALVPFKGNVLASGAQAAYQFAKGINYKHPGLSPASYLAHPVRVACLSLHLIQPPDENAVVLSLLHNVYEVSDVSPQEIVTRFGEAMSNAIRDLTVDRSQTSEAYKVGYYQRLNEGPVWARIVKLFDKLDNLFLLGLNPDAKIRETYLQDVEKFIVPIALADLPGVTNYLKALVEDCRRVGFIRT